MVLGPGFDMIVQSHSVAISILIDSLPVLVDSSLFYIRTTIHGVRIGESLTLLAFLLQAAGESINNYVASLRSLSKTCNYGGLTDNLLRNRIVVGFLDKGIRMKLLQPESKLSLHSCIDICSANEGTKQPLQAMDQPDDVNSRG